MLGLYALVRGGAAYDQTDSTSEFQWREGGLRLSPSEGLTFDVGKQVQRWGKGYAWNPVGFFERPKDPNDPQLSREGYVMVGADAVTSLSGGPLAAVGFTPVVLPVSSSVNDWLYVSPSLTSIVNLDDQSYQLTFELLYTGWENVELRLRGILTHGDEATEFGEKPSAQWVELRLRLYF